jgi:hypothetical protein
MMVFRYQLDDLNRKVNQSIFKDEFGHIFFKLMPQSLKGLQITSTFDIPNTSEFDIRHSTFNIPTHFEIPCSIFDIRNSQNFSVPYSTFDIRHSIRFHSV